MELVLFDFDYFRGFKVYSLFRYSGKVKDLIKMKYSGFRGIIKLFSNHLASLVSNEDFDVITPVPLHPARVRERGFSQTLEMAKILSLRLGKTLREYIFRHSYRKVQASLSYEERGKNVKGAYSFLKPIPRERILLVDDVITSGYTFYECAKTLLEAGAEDVIGLTLARA
jgi:Predicted amidophosphoribosyltransferases